MNVPMEWGIRESSNSLECTKLILFTLFYIMNLGTVAAPYIAPACIYFVGGEGVINTTHHFRQEIMIPEIGLVVNCVSVLLL